MNGCLIFVSPADDRSPQWFDPEWCKQPQIHDDRMGIEVIERNPFMEQGPFPP